jgi:hypothetical protein
MYIAIRGHPVIIRDTGVSVCACGRWSLTYSSHILPCTACSSSSVRRFPDVK